MSKTGTLTILLGVLCIGGLFVHRVGGQQQQQSQPAQPGQPGAEGDAPQPMFGPPPPQTRLEAIAAQKGVLVVKGYTDVGEVQGDDGSRLRLTAVSFTDARQAREAGIVVSIEQRGVEGAVIGYLDADELDPLSDALDALAKLDQGASPMANVEGVYRTRGDVEFTNHNVNGGARMVSVRTTQLIVATGQLVQASATLRPARLAEIRQQIAAAKEMLARPQSEAGNK